MRIQGDFLFVVECVGASMYWLKTLFEYQDPIRKICLIPLVVPLNLENATRMETHKLGGA
jgi:hypothetical protein